MTEQLTTVNPAEFGLEEKKANELTEGLKNILAERNVLIENYNSVISLEITPENIELFKSLRLKIRDNRTKGIEKWHKVNKEFFLTGGRFVDAIKNKEVAENERMEDKLSEAEKHFENLEKERLKVIHNKRVDLLLPFGYEIGNVDFSAMDENMFNAILTGAKTNHAAKIAEAERIESDRIVKEEAERVERERVRVENERLKAENEAKEKQLELERIEAKKIQDKKDAELKAANEKAESEKKEAARVAKIESDKQAKIIADQKAENDRIQKELKDKKDAELKAESDRIAAEKKAAKAPDKDKLKSALNSILFPVLDMKTADGHKLYIEIQDKFSKMQAWANNLINEL